MTSLKKEGNDVDELCKGNKENASVSGDFVECRHTEKSVDDVGNIKFS